ncbi:hypothetical protein HDU96_005884 [Phlyctochytrium bullatum]|nr:hypothetical protein HDU96_005884 [Phlyctochytrium bullatum]
MSRHRVPSGIPSKAEKRRHGLAMKMANPLHDFHQSASQPALQLGIHYFRIKGKGGGFQSTKTKTPNAQRGGGKKAKNFSADKKAFGLSEEPEVTLSVQQRLDLWHPPLQFTFPAADPLRGTVATPEPDEEPQHPLAPLPSDRSQRTSVYLPASAPPVVSPETHYPDLGQDTPLHSTPLNPLASATGLMDPNNRPPPPPPSSSNPNLYNLNNPRQPPTTQLQTSTSRNSSSHFLTNAEPGHDTVPALSTPWSADSRVSSPESPHKVITVPDSAPLVSHAAPNPTTIAPSRSLPGEASTAQDGSIARPHAYPPSGQPAQSGTMTQKPRTTTVEVEESSGPVGNENPWEAIFPYPASSYRKGANYIRTTKYTLLTFIPLNLYFQFRRFYNLYFLAGALSVLYGSSSLSPFSQITPLVIVLLFAAAKDAIEDYWRYQSDREANNYTAKVLRNGQKQDVLAMNLQVGDVIYLVKGEKLPVDAVILSTSYDDGTCFIDTAELDGETNLKRRAAVDITSKLTSTDAVARLSGVVQCEQPNERLTSFEGRLTISMNGGEGSKKMASLSMNNLLLRGCALRNTDFAWGAVVYTGPNTKIIKNLKQSGVKTSRLEARLQWLVIFAFLYNIIILLGSSFLQWAHYRSVQDQENKNKAANQTDYIVEWYLGASSDPLWRNFLDYFVSFFSLYTYVIPISLFVTIEIARLAQGRFMMWDRKMTLLRQPLPPAPPDAKPEKVRMKANNTNLNEDLGAVEYVFSDKTGTLTQNEMKLARWFVDGLVLDEMAESGVLGRQLRDPATPPALRARMELFSRAIATCHGVIPSVDEKTHMMVYESQSPDESALLHGIAANDVKLQFRNKAQVTISMLGTEQSFEILSVLEFNSDRKRMSVILRTPEGIHLYCKGADNIVFARLNPSPEINSPEVLGKAEASIQRFSEFGLRTLVVGYRKLTEEEYVAFQTEYDAAERSLTNREKRVGAVCEQIEKDLELLGCTAVEDRLQDEVPETIDYLLRCDIRVWLLTGDKQETAINIGMSAKLISSDMAVLILNAKSEAEVGQALDQLIESIADRTDSRPNALVVNGETLGYVFASKQEQKLLQIGINCHSVICCRVTPLQKALVVRLVRTTLKKVTLAIGDGANDVSMIQGADVGVGIMGREGNQAVRSADFAFAEFRFLRRLLAVHGRYSYHRMAQLIYYSFYKNITAITVQFWFGFYSSWSGTLVYEDIFMTAFNVIFTSVPPFFLSVFERDLNDRVIEQYPELYRQVKGGLYWNWTQTVSVLLSSLWHSLAIYYAVYFTIGDTVLNGTGRSTGYWIQVYIFITPMLLTVLLKAALMTKHWVWLTFAGLVASAMVNIIVQIFVEITGFGGSPGSTVEQHSLIPYYLLCLFVPVLCLLPDYTIILRRQYYPTDADIVGEEAAVQRRQRKAERRAGKKKVMVQNGVEEVPMTQIEPVSSA